MKNTKEIRAILGVLCRNKNKEDCICICFLFRPSWGKLGFQFAKLWFWSAFALLFGRLKVYTVNRNRTEISDNLFMNIERYFCLAVLKRSGGKYA